MDEITATYVYDRNTLFRIKSAMELMDKNEKHFGGFPPPLGRSADAHNLPCLLVSGRNRSCRSPTKKSPEEARKESGHPNEDNGNIGIPLI